MARPTYYLPVLFYFLSIPAWAQVRIELNDHKTQIVGKTASYSEQLIYVQTKEGKTDSIPTEKVSRIFFGDTLQVLVLPHAARGKKQLLSQGRFLEALQLSDYPTLFQAYTHYYDLQFTATQAGLRLNSQSLLKVAPLVKAFKSRPDIHFTITVHTDSAGKAVANQLLSERRAKAMSLELIRNGISPNHFTVLAKGESQPFGQLPSLSRRVAVQVSKVAKVNVLYAQTYSPPPIAMAALPKARENMPPPTQTTPDVAPTKKSSTRYWALTIGGEAAQILASQSPQWADGTVGPGFRLGFGGSIQVSRRFGRWVGVLVEPGYRQWESGRIYKQDGVFNYDESIKLKRIQIMIGTKIYPIKKNFYLMPSGTISGFQLITNFSEKHPVSVVTDRQQGLYAGFGGELGYEFGSKKFFGEVSVQYGNMKPVGQPIVWYFNLNEPMHTVSIRLAIGFKTFKPIL